jgi:plasmid stabilization system protein ParE
MSGFVLHPEAYGDIDEIRAYIAGDNADAADGFVDKIFDRLRKLTQFPYQGFRRPQFTSLPLRFIVLDDYLIAYAPQKNPLWVVAIIHGRRNPRTIAAILRGRE